MAATLLPLPAEVADAHPAPGGATDKVTFGFPIESLSDAEKSFSGQPAIDDRWVNVWAGFWIKHDGWSFIESSLRQANSTGHPLLIHWYYWGDAISRSNIQCNCSKDSNGNTRSVADWETMARQLADRIRTYGGGKEIVVTIEMEFNKNHVTDSDFAPYFDALLAKHSNIFRAIPNVKTVIGFGNWGYNQWGLFDDAVRNSDYLGTQFLNSTYINLARYKYAVNDTLSGVKELRRQFGPTTSFGKSKVVVYDWGLSAWQDSNAGTYTQEWNVKYLEARLADFRANGVFLFNFRALKHSQGACRPYHGCAEGWFGFRTGSVANASYDDLVHLVNTEYDRGASNQPPVARYTYACNSSRACSFDASTSTDDGSIASYSWSWGDGSAAGSGATPSHTYAADGTYTVVLTVTDNLGAQDTESKAVTVSASAPNQSPVANFTWICDGLSCNFDGTASYDPDGQVSTWSWTFGDTGTGSGSKVTHAYASAGSYTVQLTVTDNSGATNPKSATVTVAASTYQTPVIPALTEGELFRSKTTGGNYTNDSYSGGKAWNLWANGSMDQPLHANSAATYELVIRAAGDLAGPDLPHMTLRIDDILVAGWNVTDVLQDYSYVTKLTVGDHVFRINFTNDYVNGPGQDRNLKIDYLDARNSDPMLPGKFEAESFTTRSTGVAYTNASFSGGAGWNINTNGGIDQRVRAFGPANYSITIRAKEDLISGGHAHMRLLMDNVVKYETDVVGETLASYSTQFLIGAGNHTMRIEFTNDACCLGGDRNLKVDVMWMNATRPTMPGSFEAESFTNRAIGLSYTNASFSGGAGWNIDVNGAIGQDTYHAQPATYRIDILAKEDVVSGAHAHMRFKVDGIVRWETDVVGETLATYSVTMLIGAGDHTLQVEFTNDVCCPNDRNLKLDVVRLFTT